MIVYGKFADRFYISDPNYPQANANRYLSFNRRIGKFRPYFSGATAASLGTPFPTVYYINKFALINDAIASALWSQLDAGSVGDDWFPKYKLEYVKVQPDFTVSGQAINSNGIFVDGPEATIALEFDHDPPHHCL